MCSGSGFSGAAGRYLVAGFESSEQAGMLEFIGLKLSALRLRRERPEFFSLRHADHHSTAYNPMPEASSV
jgi:hypothetical protein